MSLHSLIEDAWLRIGHSILSNPDELAHRLARRRSHELRRPPRAWCLAIRASDTRIPLSALSYPDELQDDDDSGTGYQPVFSSPSPDAAGLSPSPGTPGEGWGEGQSAILNPHSAMEESAMESIQNHKSKIQNGLSLHLTSPLLRSLCSPVHIPRPGLDWTEVAKLLGCHPVTLRKAMTRGVFSIRRVRRLGGKNGPPIPILYTDQPLDPASCRLFQHADPVWGTTWSYLSDRVPDNINQRVLRLPHYMTCDKRKLGKASLHHRSPNSQWDDASPNPQSSIRNPQWNDPQWEDASPPIQNHQSKIQNPVALFRGHRFLCPSCHRLVRVLVYPLPPVYAYDFLSSHPHIRLSELDALQPPLPTFACPKCHDVRYFDRCTPRSWNYLISHLTAGLLYGTEVPIPDYFTGATHRRYDPLDTPLDPPWVKRPSRRRGSR